MTDRNTDGGMPVEPYEHFTVDRTEGGVAVLTKDGGELFEVELVRLEHTVREGLLMRVKLDENGDPDWKTAEPDEVETDRRERELHKRLEGLRKRDPGGDIEL